MVSRLATALIRLPHRRGEPADMLWRYATLTEVSRCRTPLSDKLATELAMFLDGAAAQSFARLVPSVGLTKLVWDTNPTAAVRDGLLENPLTAEDVLVAISNQNATQAADKAASRLKLRMQLREAVANDSGVIEATAALLAADDVAIFVEIAAHEPKVIVDALAVTENLELRTLVLDTLEEEIADNICSALVGVLDPACRAKVVDERLAEWLCDAESTAAEASRQQLEHDKQCSMALLTVLDGGARQRLARHDKLWSVVQRRVRYAGAGNHGPANAVDRAMLQSMRLAGMGVAEISALVFNSRIELEPEELAKELQGIDAIRLAGYFMGSNNRHPRTGEVDALVASLDPFEQHRLAEAMSGDIDELPWSDELLVGIPRRFHSLENNRQLQVIDNLISDELADDTKAWEVVLSMAEEWEGNLRSLVEAARQL